MNQPLNTTPVFGDTTTLDPDFSAALLAMTAQQAVLPRRLDDGIYAILDAEGAVQIVETPGHENARIDGWEQAHAPRPYRVWRKVALFDVASFIDYLDRNTDFPNVGGRGVGVDNGHDGGQLELWADINNRTVMAYIDGIDGWREHSATLQLKVSREWTEWAQIDGKLLSQVEFAEFIEDHLSTIAEPAGALLLDICQTLQVHTKAAFKQQQILANGQRVFRYEEELDAKAGQKGDLAIPGELTLVLRPFQGSEAVAVTARFRFQVREGVLKLGVKLAEPDKALEDAFNGIVGEVQALVPVHVNHGRG